MLNKKCNVSILFDNTNIPAKAKVDVKYQEDGAQGLNLASSPITAVWDSGVPGYKFTLTDEQKQKILQLTGVKGRVFDISALCEVNTDEQACVGARYYCSGTTTEDMYPLLLPESNLRVGTFTGSLLFTTPGGNLAIKIPGQSTEPQGFTSIKLIMILIHIG